MGPYELLQKIVEILDRMHIPQENVVTEAVKATNSPVHVEIAGSKTRCRCHRRRRSHRRSQRSGAAFLRSR